MKYNVNATVVITLDIITEFEDDGTNDLRYQAHEAAMEYAIMEGDVPMSMRHDMEITDLVFEAEEE